MLLVSDPPERNIFQDKIDATAKNSTPKRSHLVHNVIASYVFKFHVLIVMSNDFDHPHPYILRNAVLFESAVSFIIGRDYFS